MALVAMKRPAETALTARPDKRALIATKQPEPRFSELMAPTMKVEGHKGAINSMKFAPHGVHFATGSYDKQIYIWETYGECPHTLTLQGHKNAVLEVHWSPDSEKLFSASADSTVAVWDTTTGYRIKKVTGHSSFVNSCCPARRGETFVSGSDDGTARLWDLRAARKPVATFKQKYQVTAVCLSDDATQLFSGGIDNTIHCWDLREASSSSSSNDAGGADAAPPAPPVFSLKGHMDTITGISLSPDGSFLLSNAMDSTARIWDVRPFVSGGESQRCTGVMGGHQHNFEKLLLKASWSADGTLVGVGSADCQVCVFDVADSTLKYRLPGHGGSVNEVAFHPKEPIIGSCSSDMSCFLGEIDAKWDVSGAGVGGLAGDNLAAPPS